MTTFCFYTHGRKPAHRCEAGSLERYLVMRGSQAREVIRADKLDADGGARARRDARGRTRRPMLTVTFFLLGIGGVVAGCLYHESRRHAAACEQEEIDCKD